MEKILVTGGMGFIGSHLVSHLLSLGHSVTVIDKCIHKPTFCDIRKACIIEGDVLSRELVRDCLKEVDTCFHLAAVASVAQCNRDWMFSYENNVIAFNGLLDELRNIHHPVKLVYASSAAVYGNCSLLPLSESLRVVPLSTYGADKLSNEIYAEALHHLHGVPSIGLRLFNVYGPGQLKSNPYSGVITCFKEAINDNQPLKIYGDGIQTRDFIYIKDIVDAFMMAAKTPIDKTGVFNVCSGLATSIEELARIMIALSEKELSISYLPQRVGDIMRSIGSPSLAKKELDFMAKIPKDEGLAMFLRETFKPEFGG